MATNISPSFTHKMAAKIIWHRYGSKLRHCHHMYMQTSPAASCEWPGSCWMRCYQGRRPLSSRWPVTSTPSLPNDERCASRWNLWSRPWPRWRRTLVVVAARCWAADRDETSWITWRRFRHRSNSSPSLPAASCRYIAVTLSFAPRPKSRTSVWDQNLRPACN